MKWKLYCLISHYPHIVPTDDTSAQLVTVWCLSHCMVHGWKLLRCFSSATTHTEEKCNRGELGRVTAASSSSFALHSPQLARARGSTNLSTATLKRQAARADATWKGKKKTNQTKYFTPFCLSPKAAMRSASLISLSPVQHNSETIITPEDSEPDLRTQPNHICALLSPALLHTFSLSKANTEGFPCFRMSTGNVGICNKHFDFTGPWHRDGTCPTLLSSAKVEQGIQRRFSFPWSEISSCPRAHLSVW